MMASQTQADFFMRASRPGKNRNCSLRFCSQGRLCDAPLRSHAIVSHSLDGAHTIRGSTNGAILYLSAGILVGIAPSRDARGVGTQHRANQGDRSWFGYYSGSRSI
jgi:hypothetical protein